jgi:S1 RNA binding domain protein
MALEVGEILEGKVTGITNFGAFVELPEGKSGMVHISEIAPTFVKEIKDHVTEGQTVKVKVLNITEEGKISLSIKRAMTPPPQQRSNDSYGNRGPRPRNNAGNMNPEPPKRNEPISFEEMLSNFKKTSDEKMSDLKKATEAKHGGYSRRSKGNDLKGWE